MNFHANELDPLRSDVNRGSWYLTVLYKTTHFPVRSGQFRGLKWPLRKKFWSQSLQNCVIYVILDVNANSAVTALLWFLSSMIQLMVFKITIMYKCPITMMTLIWSLTRVNPHVANKMAILWKKSFPDCKQWYVFSPICIFICLIRS